uniref:Kappa-thalatoxin-Cad2a n=1 Tax=Cryptodendrum adhaesivum TaxID=659513 RepID=K1A_CRYAD|nr:RecName: Full=Kappa-thalatoxin-Cad2a; Short=Kappa-TATX-Cad2a; AltName: Full=Kappa1.3-thalatoxin-Ca1a; Short=Kappa-TATX-Ca1a; Short=Kappa1.3-TLTX-Ca1a; AltName: Full=Potassium channel peptide toxin ca-k; Short=CaK; Flags: Precursor [Cryptodendrum adhaesivum]BAJ23161.1 potassium channel peptide toxin [Cryptodendrum adhaesivum]
MKFQMIAAVLLIAFCLCVVVTARMELQDVEDMKNGSFQKRRTCIDTIPKSRCTAFQCKNSMKYRLSFCRKTCGTC